MPDSLQQFALELHNEVVALAELDECEGFKENQFTQQMIDHLSEAGELDDGLVCYHQARGVKVNGYGISQDEECLDLIIAVYQGTGIPTSVSRTQVDTAFKQVTPFLERSLDGYYSKLEESSPSFDLAVRIHDLAATDGALIRVRIFLITDGVAKVDRLADEEIAGLPVARHIWDIERLYRWWSSGSAREKIVINFDEMPCGPIPCLVVPSSDHTYTTYLAVVSADTLCALYAEHGPRLLERNVRSFLQARGKVNSGIRKTIIEEPAMFLAYNNGISATAEAADLASGSGVPAVRTLTDFQIVNGGQTTASLYHAWRKDKADLAGISVQIKLSVTRDPELVDEVVPRICEYTNSQNKVNAADFSANDSFHRQIEELSRTVWAPAVAGSSRQTRWFYESARGQFADARSREGTPARVKAFDAVHPRAQMFTKTDLAKFEMTWMQFPYIVSRGAQKNFQDFTARLKERGKFNPNEEYFRHLVAKAVLFRQTEKLVRSEGYAGYRANIVTYTIAWLAHQTAHRIDLDLIWKEQTLHPGLRAAIVSAAKAVHDVILNAPGNGNITEWCKRDACWKRCLQL